MNIERIKKYTKKKKIYNPNIEYNENEYEESNTESDENHQDVHRETFIDAALLSNQLSAIIDEPKKRKIVKTTYEINIEPLNQVKTLQLPKPNKKQMKKQSGSSNVSSTTASEVENLSDNDADSYSR